LYIAERHKGQYSVAGNSNRVSGYLHELENYLHSQGPGHDEDRSQSNDSLHEATNIHADNSTLHSLSKHFPGSGRDEVRKRLEDEDEDLLLDDFIFNLSNNSS
jgi:hypothetical protein